MLITTDRIRLRRPLMSDAFDIHAFFSDADAMTYWSSGPHANLAETEAWLRPIVDDPAGAAYDLFIEHQDRIIGKLGCWRLPEIGFILHRDYQGKGLATEALNAFIAFMRASGACDHLFADVDPRNTRSRNLLERCGFVHSGFAQNTLLSHIGWCDSDYFRLDL